MYVCHAFHNYNELTEFTIVFDNMVKANMFEDYINSHNLKYRITELDNNAYLFQKYN